GRDEVSPVLALLLENGAPVNNPVTDESHLYYDWLVIHITAMKALYDVTNVLLNHGAPISALTKDKQTALHILAALVSPVSEEHIRKMIDMLIHNKIDIDATDNQGHTALHLACIFRIDYMIKHLVARGSSIKIQTKDGKTPL
ncbi:ankyrin repeat-containing domain protein, partial [Lentinula raphanica]